MKFSSFGFSNPSGSDPIVPVPNDRLIYLNANISGSFNTFNTIWYDKSGNNNNFVKTGSLSLNSGYPSYISFETGSISHFFGSGSAANNEAITYGGWCRVPSFKTGSVTTDYIYSRWNFDTIRSILYTSALSDLRFSSRIELVDSGGNQFDEFLSPRPDFNFIENEWYYVIFTFRETPFNEQLCSLQIFVNGELYNCNNEIGTLRSKSTNKQWFVGSPPFMNYNPNVVQISTFEVWNRVLSRPEIYAAFNQNKGYFTYGPTYTPTPSPTPTPTNTPTPTPTATATPTPTPNPIPSGVVFYYDPGNISSYPGSGSMLYDLSGNNRNATINGSITWTSGTGSYFDLPGTDGVSITGATLNQTFISWSIFAGIYIDNIGNYDGLVFSRRGASNANGLGTFSTTGNLDILVNNGTEIITTQSIPTGKWAFVNGAVDNTTYTSNLFQSGSSTFTSGLKSAGSSTFDYPIILGEDAEIGLDRTLDGRIGPVLMWDRKLSTSEITQVNNYFKTRYGL